MPWHWLSAPFLSGGGVIPVFASEATGGTVTAGATASESYSETGNQNCEVTVNIGSKFTVTIPKKITLSGADGVSAYNVTAKGSIGALESIEVVPDEDFILISAGKADVPTTVAQTKTSFDYADACMEDASGNLVGTTATGNVSADKDNLSAGIWSGKFNFNISLKEKGKGSPITVEAKNESGEDLNATAFEIVGTEKDELLINLVDSGMITSAEEVNALIEVNSDDFDGLAETTFNVSTIAEEGDKVAILHFNEETNEWEYVSIETVDGEGKITADFSSYSPVAFVKVNENGSYSKHEHVYAGAVTKEATCGRAGVKTFTCYCGDSYTEEIPATGHNYVDGVCTKCNTPPAGLYDADGVLLASWEEAGIDVATNYSSSSDDENYYQTSPTSPYYVLTKNYSTATKVVIPSSVTTIGEWAFYCCRSLNSVTIPDSVTSIGEYAFGQCTGLTSVTIPDSVESIETGAFCVCSNLTSVVIPDSVTYIGYSAFGSCTGLTSVSIPDSVTYIGTEAFHDCSNLSSVTLSGNTKVQDYFNSDTLGLFEGCPNLTSVGGAGSGSSIELSVNSTCINNNLFRKCTNITSITIPDSVTFVGNNAFRQCTGLTSISIPNNVTTIGDSAFYKCTGLNTVVTEDGLNDIYASAFYGCTNLNSVFISDSVTTIGSHAFQNCTNLETVTLGENINQIFSEAFMSCEKLTDIIIPDRTTYIGNDAFNGCTSLTSAKIGKGVLNIGEGAFRDCKKLTGIVIPEGVENVYNNTFNNCTKLASVTIPDGVTEISQNAFNYCSSLTSVTIPDSVTTIGNSAFYYCTSLSSATIGNGVDSIGSRAFMGCSALSSLTIPDGVTTINSHAFYNVPHVYYNGSATGSPWGAKDIN